MRYCDLLRETGKLNKKRYSEISTISRIPRDVTAFFIEAPIVLEWLLIRPLNSTSLALLCESCH